MRKSNSPCSHQNDNQHKQFVAVEAEAFNSLVENLTILTNQLKSMQTLHKGHTLIYNNQTIKEVLNIQDKLLKKYRDDGLLAFHQVGDKFWYTEADIEQFLSTHYFPAYAIAG